MFGGWGIYFEDKMFALIADDVFYIKADATNQLVFESKGLKPFRYQGRGKLITISYYQPPVEAMDNSTALCEWARKGIEAATR